MKSRLLVAAVGIPLLLVIILFCPKVCAVAAMSVLLAIAARELLYTTGILRHSRMVIYCMVMAFAVPLWCWAGSSVPVGAALLTAFVLLLFLEALAAYPEIKFGALSACLFAGVIFPLGLSSVSRIMMLEYGRHLVFVPIMIPFINDAGGYFGGWFFGKHKLAPNLSPKKTREGAVGGVAATVLAMMIYGLVMQFGFGFTYNYLFAVIYGVVGAVVSIVGDLAFSMIKREYGIKDYGTLFRAHGGVLDRFDSMIFTAPLVELLFLLLPLIG